MNVLEGAQALVGYVRAVGPEQATNIPLMVFIEEGQQLLDIKRVSRKMLTLEEAGLAVDLALYFTTEPWEGDDTKDQDHSGDAATDARPS